ncbi:MAG TPA: hypothetical protein VN513_01720, partial [Gemmatimonadales bacterium]|nr:hypothetical protein [Gemmatimonadales bacterium]
MKLLAIAALGTLALGALDPARSLAQGSQPSGVLPTGLTPEQLTQMLQQNPQLGSVIRRQLQQSGLTAEQIHQQLSSNGYPADLLDQFLAGAQEGSAGSAIGSQEFAALQALGIVTPKLTAAL